MSKTTCIALSFTASLIGIVSGFAGLYFFLTNHDSLGLEMWLLWICMGACNYLLLRYHKAAFGEPPFFDL